MEAISEYRTRTRADCTWEDAETGQSEPFAGTEKDAYRLYLGGAGIRPGRRRPERFEGEGAGR